MPGATGRRREVELEREVIQEAFHRKQAEHRIKQLRRELDAARLRCLDCPVCLQAPAPVVCERELRLTTGASSARSTELPPPPTPPSLPSPRVQEQLLEMEEQLARYRNHAEQLEATCASLQAENEQLRRQLGSAETNLLRCEEHLRQAQKKPTSTAPSHRSHTPSPTRAQTPNPSHRAPASLGVQGKGILKRSSSSSCLLNGGQRTPSKRTTPAKAASQAKSPSAPTSPRRRSANPYCQSCANLRRRLEMVSAAASGQRARATGTFGRAERFSRPPTEPLRRRATPQLPRPPPPPPLPPLAAPTTPPPPRRRSVSPSPAKAELTRLRAELRLEQEQRATLERLLATRPAQRPSPAACDACARSKAAAEAAERRLVAADAELRREREAKERAEALLRSERGSRDEAAGIRGQLSQLTDSHKARLAKYEQALRQVTESRDAAMSAVADQDREIRRLTGELEERISQIRRLGARLEALERERMASRQEPASGRDEPPSVTSPPPLSPVATAELRELGEEVAKLRTERRDLAERSERLAAELDLERSGREADRGLWRERADERQALQTELAKLREMLAGLERERSDLRKQLGEATARNGRLESELGRVETDLASANARASALRRDLNEVNARLAAQSAVANTATSSSALTQNVARTTISSLRTTATTQSTQSDSR